MRDSEQEPSDTTDPVINGIPVPSPKPACNLAVGAIVGMNGGEFKIRSIGKTMVILEALPGTRINGG